MGMARQRELTSAKNEKTERTSCSSGRQRGKIDVGGNDKDKRDEGGVLFTYDSSDEMGGSDI
jgi:hypothetical protein